MKFTRNENYSKKKKHKTNERKLTYIFSIIKIIIKKNCFEKNISKICVQGQKKGRKKRSGKCVYKNISL